MIQLASANYIAEKEAYKTYVEKEFSNIEGARANFKLTWEADGTYTLEKTSHDVDFKLSDMRKQLREKAKENLEK